MASWLGLGLGVLLMAGSPSAAVLEFIEVHRDDVGSVDGLNGIRAVTVSPDGAHVYAAGSMDHAVAVFERDETTGLLTFVESQKDGEGDADGLAGAYSVAVSPDGGSVYLAGSEEAALAVFDRNATTGALTFVEAERDGVNGVEGLAGAKSVVVSPDNDHVYCTGAHDDAVAVFSRNASTGALTFVESHHNSAPGVDGLNNARSVAVSPDGKHLYIASDDDDAVAVFSRDASTGELTFVEVQRNDMPGVDGLDGCSEVTVSPDGLDVYGASRFDSAVTVFERDAGTGELDFTEYHQDGVGEIDGLSEALSVAVRPDGMRVYIGSTVDHAVTAFDRDALNGTLTFVESRKDGDGGGVVDGLGGVNGVAVSPDGKHLYVAGFDDDAVAVFEVPEPSMSLLQTAALAAVAAAAIRRRRRQEARG